MSIDYDLLHPTVRGNFIALANDLATGVKLGMSRTLFLPFEGFRAPARQQMLFDQKKTKARPWLSAHQYGLAVDFVPWHLGSWSWSLDHDWDFLRRCATARNLVNEIEWDRPHVEARSFAVLREHLWPGVSGL